MIEIRDAAFPADAETVRTIFRDYAQSLGIDLSFQDFEAELTALPGKYAAPAGRVLLAHVDGTLAGCIALRPIESSDGDAPGTLCEMKRLYVLPAHRQHGLGQRLANAVCGLAKAAGYRAIRLDTLPTMAGAQRLYAAMGFREIPAYVFNPVEGVRYLELDLRGWHPPA